MKTCLLELISKSISEKNMINYFEINNYALILIDIIGIWLAFWVYFANQKEKENKGFFLMVAHNSFMD